MGEGGIKYIKYISEGHLKIIGGLPVQGDTGRRLKDTVKDGGCNRRGEVDGGSWSLWRC